VDGFKEFWRKVKGADGLDTLTYNWLMPTGNQVDMRELGVTGLRVFPMALGCMGMSGMYGATDDNESIATIHAALDAGVTLLDNGDFYGAGHNEMLIGRALKNHRNTALLSVKFGALRSPDGGWGGIDARPVAVKNFAAYSLKRLGVDHIDIYRPSRLDPNVPIEDTVPPTILHPREILILRLPVWTPRINIKTSDSRRMTTSAKGKTGTYRRNALRLPSIRTPRKIAR
jgi:hypothetical protein